jgi:hypothetical protein
MPISYTIDRERKLILEKWTGDIRHEDLAAYWKRYLADPEVMEIRRTIVDLRDAEILFSGMNFGFLIETIVLPALKGRRWTTAIVVADPAQYGLSRQYQVFADRYSCDSIFSSVDEAAKWIGRSA